MQKRAFESRGCGDDRDLTTRSKKRKNGHAERSPVGGESSLNVNKAARQGEMERRKY